MTHACYHEVQADSHRELGRKLGDLFGEFVRTDIDEAREQRSWRRMVSASKPLLEQTHRFFPQYVEELEAYAKAARIPLLELWTLSLEGDLADDEYERCTTVVTNGGRLLSHNEDWDADADEAICILKKTIAGLTLLELYYYAVPLGGCAISVNSNGYIQAINSLTLSHGPAGVPRNVIARWLSETRDVEGDFERLTQIPRLSGYSHVLVGAQGDVFSIECAPNEQSLLRPALPFAHTNHFLAPDLEQYDESEKRDSTFKRYARACRLMKPRMSVSELIALGGDTHDGRTAGILNEDTIGRMVIDFDRAVAKIWLQREKRAGWVDYPLDFLEAALHSTHASEAKPPQPV